MYYNIRLQSNNLEKTFEYFNAMENEDFLGCLVFNDEARFHLNDKVAIMSGDGALNPLLLSLNIHVIPLNFSFWRSY